MAAKSGPEKDEYFWWGPRDLDQPWGQGTSLGARTPGSSVFQGLMEGWGPGRRLQLTSAGVHCTTSPSIKITVPSWHPCHPALSRDSWPFLNPASERPAQPTGSLRTLLHCCGRSLWLGLHVTYLLRAHLFPPIMCCRPRVP